MNDPGLRDVNPSIKVVRLKAAVRGAVQGVGFRPFVFRLASGLGLAGSVFNSGDGVFIEVEGAQGALEEFLTRIRTENPPNSRITSLEATWLEAMGLGVFRIVESRTSGPKRALVLPDIATCPECRAEILDPDNRRYAYPFTNCVHCGPRFSIIEALPYDRTNTSMKGFAMCPLCRTEYEDPSNRRFHAQPNACPICGPHIELWDARGTCLAGHPGAAADATLATLNMAAGALKAGRILAVKGLGGFHLMACARNPEAIDTLRRRKCREEKPLAVMFPSVEMLGAYCEVSSPELGLLCGSESPIVLARKRAGAARSLAASVAPGNPCLGVLLPYTPLHLLLMRGIGEPVVATSGNLSDEPICIDEREALERLAGIADLFLVHNRPILRHVDDSIVRIAAGREMVLRRARGYAPLPVILKEAPPLGPVLATGAHLKNTVGFSVGEMAFISQHIGDLETDAAFRAFERAATDLPRIYEARPAIIAADAHPDYLSTRYARQKSEQDGLRLVTVQHHVAHVLSCMAENEIEPPALGVAWDGTGYGPDGTVWGGEFFDVSDRECRRAGHFRHFPLPGGDLAIQEPRRAAAGVLFEILGRDCLHHRNAAMDSFDAAEKTVLRGMLERGINSPMTSSAGRLFDAVAALAGVRQITRHEGQSAMELEFAAKPGETLRAYPAPIRKADGVHILDWEPMVRMILDEVRAGRPVSSISMDFHRTLCEWIVLIAREFGHQRVILSGGCFQNVLLLEMTVRALEEAGFKASWHQRVPPNDGGIALGQIVAAARLPA